MKEQDVEKAVAELRALEDSAVLLQRMSWARAMGLTFDGNRDMYGVLGYKDLITCSDYRTLYQRGGIAGQVLDAPVDATWRGPMELIEDEEDDNYTPFEQAWHDFEQNLSVQEKLHRVDKLAGLSTYAVLLIGDGQPNLEAPLKKVTPGPESYKGIIYLTPFLGGGSIASGAHRTQRMIADDADATVWEYELNPQDPRFGQPTFYRLKRVDIGGLPQRVHWTRVLHIAEGLLDDEVFGLPAFERIHNLFDDLLKVTGGGAEAFWLRANQGLHANIDKDMDLGNAGNALDKLKQDMEAYQHNLTRWIRSRGVEINTLGSDVANFGPPADAILTQIAGAKGIPKRILTGSEMGELASSQDRDNWKDKIVGRQTRYAGPRIVKQLADRMIEYGYLPAPKEDPKSYDVKWALIETLTETEKAAGAASWQAANQAAKQAGIGIVFTDAETRDHWYHMSPLSDEQRQEITDRNTEALKQQQAILGPPSTPGAGAQPAPNAGDILQKAVDRGAVKAESDLLHLEFNPDQERDQSGKWTKAGGELHSPGEAVHDILSGKRASVAEHDVRKFLKKSLKQATPVDLTNLKVEGHLIFGGEGLGIPRADMPQIPKEMREEFLHEIHQRSGITTQREHVDPLTLKPSQKEISAQQVAIKLQKYENDPKRPFPPILVSKDNRVLDGHHHWGVMAAFRLDHPEAKIPVYRLSVNAKQGLAEMHAFDKRHGIKREAIKVAEENLVEMLADALEMDDEALVLELLNAR